MNGNDTLIQQPTNSHHGHFKVPELPRALAFLVVILLISIIVVAAGYLLGIRRNRAAPRLISPKPLKTAPQEQMTFTPTPLSPTVGEYQPTPPSDQYDTSTWQTFTSPMDGFTLRYPNKWTVKEYSSTNCGYNALGYNRGIPVYKTGIPTPYAYCRDSFDFISPDGVVAVRYIMYSDDRTDDRDECGVQAPCLPQVLDKVEPTTIEHLGTVFLVQAGKEAYLDKPIHNTTVPVIGNNLHITNNPATEHRKVGYTIWLTVPSKTGARFSFFLTPYSKREMTTAEFYDKDSVKQGIVMLKSLRY